MGPGYPPINDLIINDAGIKNLLLGINPNKASGSDNIPCRILRETADELAPVLSALFNQSLTTGQLPGDWLQARVLASQPSSRPFGRLFPVMDAQITLEGVQEGVHYHANPTCLSAKN